MKALFALGLIMYVIIAFIFAGVVPRYASPDLITPSFFRRLDTK